MKDRFCVFTVSSVTVAGRVMCYFYPHLHIPFFEEAKPSKGTGIALCAAEENVRNKIKLRGKVVFCWNKAGAQAEACELPTFAEIRC